MQLSYFSDPKMNISTSKNRLKIRARFMIGRYVLRDKTGILTFSMLGKRISRRVCGNPRFTFDNPSGINSTLLVGHICGFVRHEWILCLSITR